jgi:SPP1 gp7 family putative phage head morphogenesis protein
MLNPETIKTNSDDKHRALALVNVVKKEILNYAAARDFNVQFFNNYAQLGLTLTDVDARVSLEDRRAIVNEIDNKLGKGKAWKTRFLPQGTDIANTKDLNMREMEFGQSLKDIRDIILGVFGVPRSVFGITNEAGLAQSTVEVEKRIMWTDTIQPASYMIQEAFNQTLMKTYFPGYKVIFDYSNIDVLQDNMMDKTDLALKYQSLGYTTNEVNDMLDLGMEESDDARMNERFHSNMLLPYSGFELEEEPAKQVDEKIVKIVEILEEEEQKTVGARKYRNKYNRVLRKNEKRMVSKLGRYFAEQLGKVLAVVKQEKAQKDISETLLLTEILNLLQEEKIVLATMMKPVYTTGAEDGSALALSTLKSDAVPLANEAIVRALTNEITLINNYTYKLIRDQVKESVVAGESINDLTKRIQSVYKFNKSRARTIARTESMKVVTRSTDAEYNRAGVKKKQWASLSDSRESHLACSAQGAIPYDDVFQNGLMFPGDYGPPEEVINCRCALAPVVE